MDFTKISSFQKKHRKMPTTSTRNAMYTQNVRMDLWLQIQSLNKKYHNKSNETQIVYLVAVSKLT